MSITDELRAYVTSGSMHCLSDYLAIADRIDVEHERICYGYQREHDDWVYIRDTCWVELPKDADGEYIHVGERVQLIGNDPGTVSHMSLADDGWRVYVKYDGGIGTGSGEPKHIRHYHAPTVEDVLAKFALAYEDADNAGLEVARIIAEYAAKLKLAEGEGV